MQFERESWYIRIIQTGVVDLILEESQVFLLKARLGLLPITSRQLTYSEIAQFYYSYGYSKNILSVHCITKMTQEAFLQLLDFLGIDEEDVLDSDCDDLSVLGLSKAVEIALRNAGIRSISKLISYSKQDLSLIYHLGEKGMLELVGLVHQHGYLFYDEKIQLALEGNTLSFSEKIKLPISVIGLSTRALHLLQRASLETVFDMIQKDSTFFMKIKGIGVVDFNAIIERIHDLGLSFHDEHCKRQVSDLSSLKDVILRYRELLFQKELLEKNLKEVDSNLLEYEFLLKEFTMDENLEMRSYQKS